MHTLTNAHILVTGGLGYIGCRLVPELLAHGHRVRVLDLGLFGNNLDPSTRSNARLETIEADIRDRDVVKRALSGTDAVIHLAAMSNDPSAELDGTLTRTINLEASVNLIDLAQAAGVRRFVNASSATVYGVKETPGVTEGASHEPISLYGKYKSEVDQYLSAASTPTFAGVNLRAATVCGWSPRLRLDLTVNIFAAHCTRGMVRVFGGEQKRPNVVIDDLVRAYINLLEADAELVAGQSFNVCASNRSVLDIARVVIAVVNPAAQLKVEPIIDRRSYDISSAKIERVLGFRCAYDIGDGARQVASSIRDGRVKNPEDATYVNVTHLLNLGIATRSVGGNNNGATK